MPPESAGNHPQFVAATPNCCRITKSGPSLYSAEQLDAETAVQMYNTSRQVCVMTHDITRRTGSSWRTLRSRAPPTAHGGPPQWRWVVGVVLQCILFLLTTHDQMAFARSTRQSCAASMYIAWSALMLASVACLLCDPYNSNTPLFEYRTRAPVA